jgi:hypothetical protein
MHAFGMEVPLLRRHSEVVLPLLELAASSRVLCGAVAYFHQPADIATDSGDLLR